MSNSNEQLIDEFRKKQRETFHLDDFIVNTLNHFSHRYLATQKEPVVTASKLEDGLYAARSVEEKSEQALKDISHPSIQQKIQKISPKSLLYGLCVRVERPKTQGQVQILAFINWGHPDFLMVPENMAEKTQAFEFSEALELRRKIPEGLEQVCTLFV